MREQCAARNWYVYKGVLICKPQKRTQTNFRTLCKPHTKRWLVNLNTCSAWNNSAIWSFVSCANNYLCKSSKSTQSAYG